MTVALPLIVVVTESVAVIVWVPAVFKITLLKVCDPASLAVNVKVVGNPSPDCRCWSSPPYPHTDWGRC